MGSKEDDKIVPPTSNLPENHPWLGLGSKTSLDPENTTRSRVLVLVDLGREAYDLPLISRCRRGIRS